MIRIKALFNDLRLLGFGAQSVCESKVQDRVNAIVSGPLKRLRKSWAFDEHKSGPLGGPMPQCPDCNFSYKLQTLSSSPTPLLTSYISILLILSFSPSLPRSYYAHYPSHTPTHHSFPRTTQPTSLLHRSPCSPLLFLIILPLTPGCTRP